MATDKMKIDTSNDVRAIGYKLVGHTEDGKLVRVVFATPEKKEVPVTVPIDLAESLLPILARIVKSAKLKAGGKNERSVFEIKKGEVSSTENGSVVFSFVLPNGADFSFEIDRDGAELLLSSLSDILQIERRNTTQNPQNDRKSRH